MSPRRRDEPMPLKYWSSAGLVLTYGCGARCASCYVCCGPERTGWMEVEDALAIWTGLIEASPHGCRVHLAGGEPFGDWPRLIDLCRRAAQTGRTPLDSVETNAFWATDDRRVRERVEALDEAGLGRLAISADPYHQQFIPIDRVRRAVRIAGEVLGPERVRVRWADWLARGQDTDDLDDARRMECFLRYASQGRDRFTGRAADLLAPHLPGRAPEAFADRSCREALLRCRHVHIDCEGWVMPGTCAGIVLGRAGAESITDLWQRLDRDHAERPVLGVLAGEGPVGLLARARAAGFTPRPTYASACHLCWDLRRFLVHHRLGGDELAPRWMYADAAPPPTSRR